MNECCNLEEKIIQKIKRKDYTKNKSTCGIITKVSQINSNCWSEALLSFVYFDSDLYHDRWQTVLLDLVVR